LRPGFVTKNPESSRHSRVKIGRPSILETGMSTILSHAAVPLALSAWFPSGSLTPALVLAGAACSMVPDLDVLGFAFGIRYGDLLGHRGITHSIFFAAVLGALLALAWPPGGAGRFPVFLFLFLSTLSHPFLDAFTNGGLGVAWFAPFSDRRYFFPWRPIAAPPIGILPFFSAWGWRVIKSELVWIWLPSVVLFGAGKTVKLLG
jgi:inner membrane protein